MNDTRSAKVHHLYLVAVSVAVLSFGAGLRADEAPPPPEPPAATPPAESPSPAAPLVAAPTMDERIDRLERELDALKRDRARSKEATRKEEKLDKDLGTEAIVTWKDGFRLLVIDEEAETPEDRVIHRFRVGIRLHLDYHWFTDQGDPQDDTFLVRRARLIASGAVYRHVEFEVAGEFASAPSKVLLKNAYLNFNYLKELQFRVGQFKMPFSYEILIGSSYLDFIERAMFISVFDVERDLGVMAHGDLGFANYMIAVLNGNKSGNATDNNDDKDVALRVAFTPFKPEKDSLLENFGVGGSYTYGHEDDFIPAFATPGGTTFLKMGVHPSGRNQTGYRQRAGADLVLPVGPFKLQAEYGFMRVDDILFFPSLTSAPLDVEGWYVDAMFMLTGERQVPGKPVVPAHNFDPLHGGFGAVEFGFRFDQVALPGRVLDFQALNTRGTHRVDLFAVALNWYLYPNVRFWADYYRAWFDDPVLVTVGTRMKVQNSEDVIMFRFSIEF